MLKANEPVPKLGEDKANQADQAETVLADGHAVDKDQDHSKANQADQAEEDSAGGNAADKDQGHFKANQADQEDDKSATEIAKTCNDQETAEPPSGAGVLASWQLSIEARHRDARSSSEVSTGRRGYREKRRAKRGTGARVLATGLSHAYSS